MTKPRGEGFAALNWLDNDGDGAVQAGAFERAAFGGEKGKLMFRAAGLPIVSLSGRGAADRVTDGCRTASLVILSGEWKRGAPCRVIARTALATLGAVAHYPNGSEMRLVGARNMAGERLWNSVRRQ